MFFENRDDLSELLHSMAEDFKKSGQKKFVTQHIKSYDELSFQIVQRYIPQFNKWIKQNSDNQAEVLTKRVHRANTRRERDMFSDNESEHTDWLDLHEIYIIWTGHLPKP